MSKEKFYLAVGAIVLVAAAVLGGARFFSGDEDSWLCQNGKWVKHGNPSAVQPTTECLVATDKAAEPKIETKKEDATSTPKASSEIEISSPLSGAEISSPLIVKGRARGNWYFEASFPVQLVDESGKVLATVPAQAQDDWMTEDFVPFEVKLEFDSPAAKKGSIVFNNDNPSGNPETAKSVELPIIFSSTPLSTSTASTSEMVVKIFLGSDTLNPGANDCSKVFPVERRVRKSESVARVALEQLLAGPTLTELDNKYFTSLSSGVKIKSLVIKDGVAKVDFDKTMDKSVGGSCRVSAIRSQVVQTLKQFASVKEVIISVEGNVDEALQP